MPSWEFRGPYPTTYTAGRDVNGVNLGTVEPGDFRMFDDGPPDRWWVPVIPPGDGEGTGDGQDADPGAAEGDAPEPPAGPDPGAPQPVPPAVIPQ